MVGSSNIQRAILAASASLKSVWFVGQLGRRMIVAGHSSIAFRV
jgi:hypothetical protein